MATASAPYGPKRSLPARQVASAARVNVGQAERWLSLVGGGVLAAYGLRKGSLAGWLTAAAGAGLVYRGLSGHCSLYGTIGVTTAHRHPFGVGAGRGVKVVDAVTIHRPAAELYEFCRDLRNFPQFMDDLESIEVDGNRSHWVMRGPLGVPLHWDAEISHERTNELIAWRSLEGGNVDTAGSLHFTPPPVGAGTEVRIEIKVDPPAGKLGAAVAHVFGEDPASQVRAHLRKLKQLMEAGAAVGAAG